MFWDEKGIHTFSGFVGIITYCQMFHIPFKHLWDLTTLEKGRPDISSALPRDIFWMIFRNFRFGSKRGLPSRGQPGYHPLGWFLPFVHELKLKSKELWKTGKSKTRNYIFRNVSSQCNKVSFLDVYSQTLLFSENE